MDCCQEIRYRTKSGWQLSCAMIDGQLTIPVLLMLESGWLSIIPTRTDVLPVLSSYLVLGASSLNWTFRN